MFFAKGVKWIELNARIQPPGGKISIQLHSKSGSISMLCDAFEERNGVWSSGGVGGELPSGQQSQIGHAAMSSTLGFRFCFHLCHVEYLKWGFSLATPFCGLLSISGYFLVTMMMMILRIVMMTMECVNAYERQRWTLASPQSGKPHQEPGLTSIIILIFTIVCHCGLCAF